MTTQASAPAPRDYKGIDLWHRKSGSLDYYIRNLQERAAASNAPIDAVYQRDNGEWVCVSDLHEHHPFRVAYKELTEKNA